MGPKSRKNDVAPTFYWDMEVEGTTAADLLATWMMENPDIYAQLKGNTQGVAKRKLGQHYGSLLQPICDKLSQHGFVRDSKQVSFLYTVVV